MGLTNYSLKKSGEQTPPGQEETPPSSQKDSSSLDKLVESIYNSVVYAQRKVETEHLNRVMSTYFDKEGNPITFKVNLPSNDGEMKEAAVPLLTLAPNTHLGISELEMSLKVDLGECGDEENLKNKKLSAKITGERNKDLAEIKIKLTGMDSPEGLAKINDQLIKILPN